MCHNYLLIRTRQEYEKCTSKLLGGAKFIDDHAFLLLFWLRQLCFLRSRLVAFTRFSLSFSLYIYFFLFARCTSLRATKGEYTPTQFHLTQDSNLVVYFANLLTSFGFDGVPLFATFVSIPTITCRWTCKGMFD